MKRNNIFLFILLLIFIFFSFFFYSTTITEPNTPQPITQEQVNTVIQDISGSLNSIISPLEKQTDANKKADMLKNLSNISNTITNTLSTTLAVTYPISANDSTSLLSPFVLTTNPSDTSSISNFISYINKNNIVHGVLTRITSIQKNPDATIVIDDINHCNKLMQQTIYYETQKLKR